MLSKIGLLYNHSTISTRDIVFWTDHLENCSFILYKGHVVCEIIIWFLFHFVIWWRDILNESFIIFNSTTDRIVLTFVLEGKTGKHQFTFFWSNRMSLIYCTIFVENLWYGYFQASTFLTFVSCFLSTRTLLHASI